MKKNKETFAKNVKLYEIVKGEINKLDPMGLFPECPTDEYDIEIERILPEIESAETEKVLAEKMANILNEMFDEKFSAKKFVKCAENIMKKCKI